MGRERIKLLVKSLDRFNLVSSADAQWSQWGRWTTCSKTCGIGKRIRRRLCINPGLEIGDRYCTQLYPKGYGREQERNCNIIECPGERLSARRDAETMLEFCTSLGRICFKLADKARNILSKFLAKQLIFMSLLSLTVSL